MNPPDAEPLDSGLDLPPGLRGTPFQQRVWQACAGVPAGLTANYADLARAIGIPGAVRAVAQNCGAGALAVVVLCHGVVRSDGALSPTAAGAWTASARCLIARRGRRRWG